MIIRNGTTGNGLQMKNLPNDWSWSEYTDDDLVWFIEDHERSLEFNPRQKPACGLTSHDWIAGARAEQIRRQG